MPDPCTYDYALIRVVPRVERGECANVGVILACAPQRYLKAAIEVDEVRLRALDPGLDMAGVRAALAAIEAVCRGGDTAGPIGKLSVRERFDWLVAPRSTVVQTSPVHAGRHHDLDAALAHLLRRMVQRPEPRTEGAVR